MYYSISNNQTTFLQSVYAPSASGTVFAPLAEGKYLQTGSSAVAADNFYAILAERVKTSAEKTAEYNFGDWLERIDNDTAEKRILDILTGAGIFKTEDEEEEEEEEEKKAVEVLLKALKANRETSKEETIDTKKDDRLTVKEVKEVLSGLKCASSITAKIS